MISGNSKRVIGRWIDRRARLTREIPPLDNVIHVHPTPYIARLYPRAIDPLIIISIFPDFGANRRPEWLESI